MAPPLFIVPFTFLTINGLSNFCSLNPCLAAVCLSMNIPVAPLSKSALIIMPSCVSIFSTPIFNYTSFNILKILLTFFRLPLSLAALSGSLDHVPLSSPLLRFSSLLLMRRSAPFLLCIHTNSSPLFSNRELLLVPDCLPRSILLCYILGISNM